MSHSDSHLKSNKDDVTHPEQLNRCIYPFIPDEVGFYQLEQVNDSSIGSGHYFPRNLIDDVERARIYLFSFNDNIMLRVSMKSSFVVTLNFKNLDFLRHLRVYSGMDLIEFNRSTNIFFDSFLAMFYLNKHLNIIFKPWFPDYIRRLIDNNLEFLISLYARFYTYLEKRRRFEGEGRDYYIPWTSNLFSVCLREQVNDKVSIIRSLERLGHYEWLAQDMKIEFLTSIIEIGDVSLFEEYLTWKGFLFYPMFLYRNLEWENYAIVKYVLSQEIFTKLYYSVDVKDYYYHDSQSNLSLFFSQARFLSRPEIFIKLFLDSVIIFSDGSKVFAIPRPRRRERVEYVDFFERRRMYQVVSTLCTHRNGFEYTRHTFDRWQRWYDREMALTYELLNCFILSYSENMLLLLGSSRISSMSEVTRRVDLLDILLNECFCWLNVVEYVLGPFDFVKKKAFWRIERRRRRRLESVEN